VPGKAKFGRIATRVDEFYAVCEKILLRTILFACFLAELGRFVVWLFR
jgi:hypothetical protein